MPKNRKRVPQKGAKSVSIRTKHKIGGRRSGTGTGTMSDEELRAKMNSVRKRDRNKLYRALVTRGLI